MAKQTTKAHNASTVKHSASTHTPTKSAGKATNTSTGKASSRTLIDSTGKASSAGVVTHSSRALTTQGFQEVMGVIRNPPKAETSTYMKQAAADARRVKIVS